MLRMQPLHYINSPLGGRSKGPRRDQCQKLFKIAGQPQSWVLSRQEGRHNFLSTGQIVTKFGGCVSHAKIALEPRPHAQENSESPAIFIFVCRS